MCTDNADRKEELAFRGDPEKDVDGLKMAYINL